MPFARLVEANGTLTVTQTNHAALRDLWVSLKYSLQSAALFLFVVCIAPHLRASPRFSWDPFAQQAIPPVALFLVWSVAGLWPVIRSVNRLCGSRTCLFDKNQGIFFYNGFHVGPLREIWEVKPQVRNGMGQNPMFRLVLKLPGRRLTMIVLETYYIPAPKDFVLTRNAFSDPNKRFAIFEDWIDCDRQDLVPFVPPEVVEIQREIAGFLADCGVGIASKAWAEYRCTSLSCCELTERLTFRGFRL